jgi:heme/copper-type cytochrome/quinol oxidase subunit 3
VTAAPPAEAVEVLDVSRLPTYQFGARNVVWWGTLTFMATEGAIFVLLAVSYFYVWTRHLEWPPPGMRVPDVTLGTLSAALFVLSAIPNRKAKRAAESQDLRGARVWMPVCLAFAVAILALRWFEFPTLNCRWSQNVYTSLVWLLLGFHTFHLLTDLGDTAVLTVLMFTGPVDSSRFGDVSENALYWSFVVIAWLPMYALIYWAPRVL